MSIVGRKSKGTYSRIEAEVLGYDDTTDTINEAKVDSDGHFYNKNYVKNVAGLVWQAMTQPLIQTDTFTVIVDQSAVLAELYAINSLAPSKYDSITCSYTGTNLTGVVYKLGITTISTLVLAYTGSQLDSITKT